MNSSDLYQIWLKCTLGNAELRSELERIAGDLAEIEDRFYRELEFGTGGLRGILGAGTNRMNVFTVAKATQGYANYLKVQFDQPSVAIAYDSRIHSDLFAKTAAQVFAANGVRVYFYPKLMPTPALSFAVRDLRCSGGVVITASHNPAKYNGYKVYGSDGCQITTATAKAIQMEIDLIDPFVDVNWADFDAEYRKGVIQLIGEETVERYLAAIKAVSVLPYGVPRDVSIVYTPLNGAGISCVPRCLSENGFNNITLVEEQKDPNGDFPTCPYPNPEIREALTCGLQWAEKTGSDLLLATDPDCDRVGVAVKDGEKYTLINGNDMGVLLFDFVCRMRKENGTLPTKPVAIKTIVTTPAAEKIAADYHVELRSVLTGFKFIGEQIGLLEEAGEKDRFVFGFEESYGYLSGSFVRDKDAVNASLLICEMFAYYKAKNKSLTSVLRDLYDHYGWYATKLLSFAFEGSKGFEKMQTLMNDLRKKTPTVLGGLAVKHMVDYQKDETGLPKSNVLHYILQGGAEAVIRPSGTEPKLKIYLTGTGKTEEESAMIIEQLERQFNTWVSGD